ncbi:hypothetical protein VTN77DRAFT_7227 [Rasamsonia byssochlamydoides]|uniref:uncharacterized protein n=1 Tax=Rasamsonia byssochlamydoides TaxID=89139 RepID=UPI0037443DE4
MTSHPAAQCCTVGVRHEGKAVGEIGKIGNISTYFSYPKDRNTENAVLILTDVMGHEFINAQLIADQFAANGYFTVMPDLFNGDAVPLNYEDVSSFDVFKWLQRHTIAEVDPIVEAVIKELRGGGPLPGSKHIGAVGYCFGGKYVCRFLKEGFIDAGFIAHPSSVEPDELGGIEGPLSIAAAEKDFIFPASKRHESEAILAQKDTIPYQITLFSGTEHGFAVRCDLSASEQRFAKEQAFLQAVRWFDEFIKL